MHNKISLTKAQETLQKSAAEFAVLFAYGTLTLELYQPHETDKQTPHEQDEVYIIAAGQSKFFLEGEITEVITGDFIFVPAGAEHRFLEFTQDFSTWVLFYGPKGGEKSVIEII